MRHVLRGGLLPVVSFLGPGDRAHRRSGAIVVEKIFAIPGIGRTSSTPPSTATTTLVMGVVLFYAVLLLVLNLLVDVAYGFLDPRVR